MKKKPSFFHFQSIEDRLKLPSRRKQSPVKETLPTKSSPSKLEKIDEVEDPKLREHCAYLRQVRKNILKDRLTFERGLSRVASPFASQEQLPGLLSFKSEGLKDDEPVVKKAQFKASRLSDFGPKPPLLVRTSAATEQLASQRTRMSRL